MDITFLVYSLGFWVLLAVCAIVNGMFRQYVLVRRIGLEAARPVSSLTLSLMILAVAYLMLCAAPGDYDRTDLWIVGAVWLSVTVLFEFGFGHFVMKRTWSVLLEDYNILKGRTWAIVLVVTALAPYLMGSAVQGRWL